MMVELFQWYDVLTIFFYLIYFVHEVSVEQVLPDSPFASPKKSTLGQHSDFSSLKADGCGPNTLPSSSQSNSSLPSGPAGDITSP